MRIFSTIFWILVLLIGVSFAAINSRSVEVHYYLGKADIYLPLLMLIELAVGVLLGVLVMLPQILKLKSVIRKQRQQNKRFEAEIQALQSVQKGKD